MPRPRLTTSKSHKRQPRTGRPKLPASALMTARIQVPLTKAEKATVAKAVRSRGPGFMTTWIREVVLTAAREQLSRT